MKNNHKQFNTPILLLIFNRPQLTKLVFQRIKEIRPNQLYISSDGPRKGNQSDHVLVQETRMIFDEIDWDCNVKTLYRENNLGCKNAVSSGINWFFENVEKGIIIEDDCLLDDSFFHFAEELLEKYANDTRIMHIGAANFHDGWKRDSDYSYYFSSYGHIWGWATWRRAWKLYDVNLSALPEVMNKKYLKGYLSNNIEIGDKLRKMKKIFNGEIDTWDYQWEFTLFINNGLAIIPNENLVQNIGFGKEATHTTNENDAGILRKIKTLDFPINHPGFVIKDRVSDRKFYMWVIINKIKSKLTQILPFNK